MTPERTRGAASPLAEFSAAPLGGLPARTSAVVRTVFPDGWASIRVLGTARCCTTTLPDRIKSARLAWGARAEAAVFAVRMAGRLARASRCNNCGQGGCPGTADISRALQANRLGV